MFLSPLSAQDLATMARPHVAYDHSRLVAIAEQASKSTNLKGVDVACKYVQEEAGISSHSKVTFERSATTPEYESVQTVNVLAFIACSQGIPLPASWRTASLRLPLDEMAGRSADAERSSAYPGLTCEILGMPKTFADTSNGDSERAPGSVVILQAQAGERLAHLLCAHVERNRWLCHRGSFLECVFEVENPFDAADLEEKDVARGAWSAAK